MAISAGLLAPLWLTARGVGATLHAGIQGSGLMWHLALRLTGCDAFNMRAGTGKTLVARALAAMASRAGRKVAFFMRPGRGPGIYPLRYCRVL